jgi:hypothetical protein
VAVAHDQPAIRRGAQRSSEARHGLLIVLLREHRTDEADHRGPVGKDADDIAAAPDLLVETLEVARTAENRIFGAMRGPCWKPILRALIGASSAGRVWRGIYAQA